MLLANAFEIETAVNGISYVRVCIFGAVHVDLSADLRSGNPSKHATALESHSVRECDGKCQSGPQSLRFIVDVSGDVEKSVRGAMRALMASMAPPGEDKKP